MSSMWTIEQMAFFQRGLFPVLILSMGIFSGSKFLATQLS